MIGATISLAVSCSMQTNYVISQTCTNDTVITCYSVLLASVNRGKNIPCKISVVGSVNDTREHVKSELDMLAPMGYGRTVCRTDSYGECDTSITDVDSPAGYALYAGAGVTFLAMCIFVANMLYKCKNSPQRAIGLVDSRPLSNTRFIFATDPQFQSRPKKENLQQPFREVC